MEEVRRELIKRFGEEPKDGPNSLYGGGLWVRSSMDPTTQDAAAQALRDGLTRFDGGRGWSDLAMKIDLARDWAARLDAAPVGTGYPDWRKAVVLNKGDAQATVGFANGTTGVVNASDAAMPKRGLGGRAFDFLEPGMVIIVKQIGGANYALRSLPEVSGGMLVEEVHTGRVMAMLRRAVNDRAPQEPPAGRPSLRRGPRQQARPTPVPRVLHRVAGRGE